MNEEGPQLTRQERSVRVLMSSLILLIGIYTTLGMALPRVFSEDDTESVVAMFLVFVGLLFCQTGAALVQYFSGPKTVVGQALFAVSFAVSLLIVLVGLAQAFAQSPGAIIYLVLMGFISAVIGLLAMR